MRRPTLDTFADPRCSDRNDPAALYVRSYLLIRTVVGLIGILLPLGLIAGTGGGTVNLSRSLSSYYHSPMQDVFVGSLCVIAVLLTTYLAGQPWTWDFLLSLGAGLALLVVVFFPVRRPGLTPGAPWCGSTPLPSGCSPVQQLFGELFAERIHLIAAAVCFVLIAALSFLFARRERAHGGKLVAPAVHAVCGVTVLVAVCAAGLAGFEEFGLWQLPPLYAAETVAVWAFGASWLLAGRDLWLRLRLPRARAAAAVPQCPDPRDAPPLPSSTGVRSPVAGSQAADWYGDPYLDIPALWSEPSVDDRTWTAGHDPACSRSNDVEFPGPSVDELQPHGSSGAAHSRRTEAAPSRRSAGRYRPSSVSALPDRSSSPR